MKLLLTSFWTSPEQDVELINLVGKALKDIKVAYIENAYDVYNDEASLVEVRQVLKDKGFDFELVDLRNFRNKRQELRQKLVSKDIFWFTGGNPYTLRWLMKASGADKAISELVGQGKV